MKQLFNRPWYLEFFCVCLWMLGLVPVFSHAKPCSAIETSAIVLPPFSHSSLQRLIADVFRGLQANKGANRGPGNETPTSPSQRRPEIKRLLGVLADQFVVHLVNGTHLLVQDQVNKKDERFPLSIFLQATAKNVPTEYQKYLLLQESDAYVTEYGTLGLSFSFSQNVLPVFDGERVVALRARSPGNRAAGERADMAAPEYIFIELKFSSKLLEGPDPISGDPSLKPETAIVPIVKSSKNLFMTSAWLERDTELLSGSKLSEILSPTQVFPTMIPETRVYVVDHLVNDSIKNAYGEDARYFIFNSKTFSLQAFPALESDFSEHEVFGQVSKDVYYRATDIDGFPYFESIRLDQVNPSAFHWYTAKLRGDELVMSVDHSREASVLVITKQRSSISSIGKKESKKPSQSQYHFHLIKDVDPDIVSSKTQDPRNPTGFYVSDRHIEFVTEGTIPDSHFEEAALLKSRLVPRFSVHQGLAMAISLGAKESKFAWLPPGSKPGKIGKPEIFTLPGLITKWSFGPNKTLIVELLTANGYRTETLSRNKATAGR